MGFNVVFSCTGVKLDLGGSGGGGGGGDDSCCV